MLNYDEYTRRKQQIKNQLFDLKRKKVELKRQQLILQKEKDEQKYREMNKNLVDMKKQNKQ